MARRAAIPWLLLSTRRAAIPWLLLSTATANLMFPMFFLGELIVFPDEALPLQIFEPRYRLLVARCLGDLEAAADLAVLSPFVGDADPCKFGILFERLGRGARGVLATIDRASIETAEEPVAYKLVATGTERFAMASDGFWERVETLDEEQPPLVHANVTLVDDEDVAEHPPPRWEQIRRRLKWLFGADARDAVLASIEDIAPPGSSSQAFALARQLPLAFRQRCELLSLTSGAARWIRIADILREWLQAAKRARQERHPEL